MIGLVLDNQKDVLLRQLAKLQNQQTAWMFGYRIHPITHQPQRHNGVDLPDPEGTPIRAVLSGRVSAAWLDETYGGGNSVILAHIADDVASTGYCHMVRWADGLRVRDRVTQGQVIGYVGMTGMATGPHLHFTCRNPLNGVLQCVDPLPFLCEAAGVVEMPDDHRVGNDPPPA